MRRNPTSHITLELPSGRAGSVDGFTALSGQQFIEIKYAKAVGQIPVMQFMGDQAKVKSCLAEQRVLILPKADWGAVMKGVEAIDNFPPQPVLDCLGSTGEYFALPDGKVLSPFGNPKARLIQSVVVEGSAIKGTLPRWKREVAEPLTGQTLPMIVIMAALAAPILRFSGETHNPGLELCGPKGKGKTTLLNLGVSVSARPGALPTFDATRIGLKKLAEEYEDRLLPIDEESHLDRGNTQFFQSFVFGMASGTPRITAFDRNVRQRRYILLVTTNQSYHESLKGRDQHTIEAALDRLLPIAIDRENPLGVFDFLPESFATSGDFARYLEQKMRALHGWPIRRFMQCVVNARAKDALAFDAGLQRFIRAFEAEVGLASTREGRSRPSATLGLLYAAGVFAQSKGILPDRWDCLAACKAAYRNYQAQLPAHTPLATRLLSIATNPATLDLRGKQAPRLKDDELEAHGAFLKHGKKGRVELLLTDGVADRFFPDWRAIANSVEFQAVNLRDRDHRTKQRQVRAGKKKERFYCFVLDAALASQLPSSG